MNWFIYSIIAVVNFTAYDILSRKISIDSKNPRALSVVYNATITLLTPLLFLIEPYRPQPISTYIMVLTFFNILIWGAFGRVEYYAHKYVEASVLAIILKLAPALVLIYSLIFFGESLNVSKLVGILLILASNIYVVLVTDRQNLNFKKGLIYAILSAVFLSIGWALDKVVSPSYGIALFSFISFCSPTLLNSVLPPLKKKDLAYELRRVNWKLVVLAFFNLVGYAALVKALMLGDASKVTAISTGTTPFVILFSFILLKERSNLFAKVISGLLTVLGILLLR